MKFATVPEAARELGVSEETLRRAARKGKVSMLRLGNRYLIDLDDARERFNRRPAGLTMDQLMEATGLTRSAIQRGIREGWLPSKQASPSGPGSCHYFNLDAVQSAIRARMHIPDDSNT